jgi:hypothetical protein
LAAPRQRATRRPRRPAAGAVLRERSGSGYRRITISPRISPCR